MLRPAPFLCLAGLLVVLGGWNGPAAAGAGVRAAVIAAGAYRLAVSVSPGTPQAGGLVDIRVRSAPGGPPLAAASITIRARPGPVTPATPTRAVRLAAGGDRSEFRGDLELPVRGAWELVFYVTGPAGDGVGDLGVTAAAPGALPLWAGWLIGLSPLAGLGWFFCWNHRYLRQIREEENDENRAPLAGA